MTLPSAPDVEGLRELLAKATPLLSAPERASIRYPDPPCRISGWALSPDTTVEEGMAPVRAATQILGALPALLDAHAQLTAQAEAMRKALEPFAALGRLIDSAYGPRTAPDDGVFQSGAAWRQADGSSRTLAWGDFRAARHALESQSK